MDASAKVSMRKHIGVLLLALLCLLVFPGTGLCSSEDSVLAIIPLDIALSDRGLDSYRGFALSPEEMLIVLPAPEAGKALSGIPTRDIQGRSDVSMWIAAGRLPDRALEGVGARLIYRGEFSTVFEADLDAAHALISRGYRVVEAVLLPLEELRQPSPGERLTLELLGDRPLTARRRTFMSGLADSVDVLAIEETIHHLQYDDTAGEYRSRYACREDLNDDIASYIYDKLGGIVGPQGGYMEPDCFKDASGPCVDTYFCNIIADKPGKKTERYYIVCAHYDATASREPLWDHGIDPAPGADDNATGVAALLECAELLAPLDLDVGLKFMAFSAEEIGLRGSRHHAMGIEAAGGIDSVLGVINVDMVGYLDDEPKVELVYDWKSRWLSDQLEEAADIAGVETWIRQLDLTGIPVSDHFSYWQIGIPGIMYIEELDGTTPVNPNYHTLGDTLGILDMEQVADIARAVVGFLSRFAPLPEDTLADIELTEGSVEWDWAGRNDPEDAPVAGDSVLAKVRALNVGASGDGSYQYGFEIWQGPRDTGNRIHQSTELLELLSGEYTDLTVSWFTDPDMHGRVPFTFVLEPLSPEMESDLSNNEVEVTLEIMSQRAVLENLHVFPNPVTWVPDAYIAFDIYHPDGDFDGIMDIWIFDLLGREIGFGTLERSHAKSELEIGRNAVSLSDFLASGSDLPPGLYLCIAKLGLLRTARTFEATSKFAVDR